MKYISFIFLAVFLLSGCGQNLSSHFTTSGDTRSSYSLPGYVLLQDDSPELIAFKQATSSSKFADYATKMKDIDQKISAKNEEIDKNGGPRKAKDKILADQLKKEINDLYIKKLELTWKVKAITLSAVYPPVAQVKISDKTFLTSRLIVKPKRRDYAIIYTKDETGSMVARLLYHSKSDGSWRVAPHVSTDGTFSKGMGVHYTQETKPHLAIVAMLDDLKAKSLTKDATGSITQFFSVTDVPEYNASMLFLKNVDTNTISPPTKKALTTIQSCQPGSCFTNNKLSDKESELPSKVKSLIENVNTSLNDPALKGFVPDFTTAPLFKTTFHHTFFGTVDIEIYEGVLDGKKVEWHMAHDKDGRIWIDRIAYKNSPISSYGVNSTFIDSGVLTNKPLEYSIQAWDLQGVEFDDRQKASVYFDHPDNVAQSLRDAYYAYMDITGFLDQLAPIASYRHAKNIVKKTL